MKAYVESHGCTHNDSDARIIRGVLTEANVELILNPADADFIFINSCAVKQTTEQKMLSRITELSKNKGQVVVCGCLPKVNPKKARATGALLVDTDSLNRIPELLQSPKNLFSDSHSNKLALPFDSSGNSVSIQIAEGCLGNCSYCGTKNSRGALYSYSPKDIRLAVECALSNGAKEILLTAEDTGAYGTDINTSFPELLHEITSIEGDFMVRVGMMNPEHALRQLPQLLHAFENEKIYKFFHIPLQSGSDEVLQSMRRNYSTADFEKVVSVIRKKFPNATIGTDIIVAFPTETERDFQETCALLERVRPDVTNTSRFGSRPNTEASQMKQLPTEIAKTRSSFLSSLARRFSLENNERYVGEEYATVALAPGRTGNVVGRAPNYKQLVFEGILGERCTVVVEMALPTYLEAQRIK